MTCVIGGFKGRGHVHASAPPPTKPQQKAAKLHNTCNKQSVQNVPSLYRQAVVRERQCVRRADLVTVTPRADPSLADEYYMGKE